MEETPNPPCSMAVRKYAAGSVAAAAAKAAAKAAAVLVFVAADVAALPRMVVAWAVLAEDKDEEAAGAPEGQK